MAFTLGCDPEIFVTQKTRAISAHGLIPGSKTEPFPTPNGAVQVDGMALELNTNPVPVEDFESFNEAIVKQIGYLRDKVNEGRDENDRIAIAIKPVMDFDKDVMDAAPEEAKELGCDPDFSAYTMEANPRPQGDDVLFRTGAGHIHVGWGADIPTDNADHMAICAGFVKALDCTVGLLMTVLDREPRRRILYGKAGAFRPKSYGVEYRTPSNVWIKKRETRQLVHYLVNKAIFYHSRGYGPEAYFAQVTPGKNVDQELIQKIIDEGDHVSALTLLDQLLSGNKNWLKNREALLQDAVKAMAA